MTVGDPQRRPRQATPTDSSVSESRVLKGSRNMRFGAIIPAVVGAGITLTANSGVAFAYDGDHMGDWGGDWGGGWWIAMVFMMVIFWAAIIALVIWGVRSFAGPRHDSRTPLDIARERLAKGEISEEEFERIKRQLV